MTNISYLQYSASDKQQKMRQVYVKLGKLYELDGNKVFSLQHQGTDDQFTEAQEDEYEYNNFTHTENHFSSVRNPESQGYQALRTKGNADFKIRPRNRIEEQ